MVFTITIGLDLALNVKAGTGSPWESLLVGLSDTRFTTYWRPYAPAGPLQWLSIPASSSRVGWLFVALNCLRCRRRLVSLREDESCHSIDRM